MTHDIRDQLVDFVLLWAEKTEIRQGSFLNWMDLSCRKYRDWRHRYGKVNEHNRWVPRDHWLESWEKEAIVEFSRKYPLEGYRRLCFMMLDRDIVAVSPSSVYRVLKAAGLLGRGPGKSLRKGSGFEQPLAPHDHWHIGFSYVNVGGTFYYLCSVLDGCSRSIIHWEIRESMKESDAEIVLQRAREKHPQARPRIISDNGPQFISKDFKEYLRQWQTEHVRTSPYYPESNGKLERYHRTLKEGAIRPKTPLSLEDAQRIVGDFVDYYNRVRLHSALGYVSPQDRLEGRHTEIYAERDRKLEEAREQRRKKRCQTKTKQ